MLVIFLVYRPKKNTSFISYNPSFHVFFFIYPPQKKKKQHNNAGAPVFCFRKGRPKTNPSLWKVVKPVISQKAQGFGLRSWGSIEGVGGPRDHFGVEENCHFVRGNKGFEHDRGEKHVHISIYMYILYICIYYMPKWFEHHFITWVETWVCIFCGLIHELYPTRKIWLYLKVAEALLKPLAMPRLSAVSGMDFRFDLF